MQEYQILACSQALKQQRTRIRVTDFQIYEYSTPKLVLVNFQMPQSIANMLILIMKFNNFILITRNLFQLIRLARPRPFKLIITN